MCLVLQGDNAERGGGVSNHYPGRTGNKQAVFTIECWGSRGGGHGEDMTLADQGPPLEGPPSSHPWDRTLPTVPTLQAAASETMWTVHGPRRGLSVSPKIPAWHGIPLFVTPATGPSGWFCLLSPSLYTLWEQPGSDVPPGTPKSANKLNLALYCRSMSASCSL